jgi:RimJ/RimL family protein N-acetyltransferase
VSTQFKYEPLSLDHTDELAALLLNEPVYRHIGGEPPTLERFRIGMARALAGPQAHRAGETWINFAVRECTSDRLVGRLEATIHSGVAEVAFLYGPQHWGNGFATQGLRWLHTFLIAHPTKPRLWATTVPANTACQTLLLRCGYEQVPPTTAPDLITYDPGDLVFRGPSAA